jgi:hypothetical protein
MKPALKSVGDELQAVDAEQPPLSKLRQAFPAHQISKLPKPTKKQTEDVKLDFKKGIRCAICGSWHHPDVVHLDYVGHAALTDRLLDTDLEWSWEPVGFTPEGLPALDRNGGLWIKLTVCGVTRYGYGAADGKSGGDAMKEMIGDALRNAAMRFGAALDLWHKGDLHAEDDETPPPLPKTGETPPNKRVQLDGPYKSATALKTACHEFAKTLENMGDMGELIAWEATADFKEFVEQVCRDAPQYWFGSDAMPAEFVPLAIRVASKRRELEECEGLTADA